MHYSMTIRALTNQIGNGIKRDHLTNQRKEEIEDLLTVMQVKKILNISSQLVYKLIAQKKLDAVEFEGSKRIKKVDVIDYIEKHNTFINC